MKSFAGIRTVALSVGLVGLTASYAHAQATRTWVSGVGDDLNPCSRTAPCKTYAGAISKTAAGGFIDVLDPGAFGAVTITKSLTIDGGGFLAGTLATSAINGIIVNNASAVVHLRNMSIESPKAGTPSTPGLNGVNVIDAAHVYIERCVIGAFSNAAVFFHPTSNTALLGVTDTTVMNNAVAGILVQTGKAMIENLRAYGNGAGVSVTGVAIVTVRKSYAGGNTTGFQATVNPAAILNIEDSTSANNTNGIVASQGTTIRVSNSFIVSNLVGLSADVSSSIVSLQGNSLTGNPTAGAFTSTVVKQ